MNDLLTEVQAKIPRRLDSSPVFQRKDGSKFHNMRTSLKIAMKRAGISHVRSCYLRHTCASHLVMGGVDIRTVQELHGHRDIRMIMRYSHLVSDHTRNAVIILDSHYLDTKRQNEDNQGIASQA